MQDGDAELVGEAVPGVDNFEEFGREGVGGGPFSGATLRITQ